MALLDGYGNQIDFVDYDDKSPWPEEADGNGSYLELMDLEMDNSLASSWTVQSILQVLLLVRIRKRPPKMFVLLSIAFSVACRVVSSSP